MPNAMVTLKNFLQGTAMYQATMERRLTQNRNQDSGIDYFKERIVAGNRKAWKVEKVTKEEPVQSGGYWIHRFTFYMQKVSGRRNDANLVGREWENILENFTRLGGNSKWQDYPWKLISYKAPDDDENSSLEDDFIQGPVDGPVFEDNGDEEDNSKVQTKPAPDGVRHAAGPENPKSLEEVREEKLPIIEEFIRDEVALENSEYFQGIYARGPHIRTVLSSVKSFLETNGERRNHTVLYGLPACAKTQILNGVANLLGEDAVLRLDATSTTSAGIYKLFFKELDVVPPVVIMEEAEKTSEEALRVWLGALDDRGELRKVNYREMKVRSVQILCLATVNDKEQFDMLMGGKKLSGGGIKPGALSSRFHNDIECPRPNSQVMRKILARDIREKGGRMEWIDPIVELSELIETNDPRKVLALLDGGDRLMTGEYQRDILEITGHSGKLDQITCSA